MIITRLQGGLGNQMFQYAAGMRLALRHSVELKVDTRYLLDRNPRFTHVFRDFDLPIFPHCPLAVASDRECEGFIGRYPSPRIDRLRRRLGLFPHWLIQRDVPSLNLGILEAGDHAYLDGYWQSDRYFLDVANEVRRRFTLDPPEDPATRELGNSIASCAAVCINIRRGDFVAHTGSTVTHGFSGVDYHLDALRRIALATAAPTCFIFSDEVDWCRVNLAYPFATVFVDHRYAGEKFAGYLWLMTLCRYFIIPNSSFAWWAAWLGSHQDKQVYAPRRWFADEAAEAHSAGIVPDSWHRV